MTKWLVKYWAYMAGLLLLCLYVWGLQNMYFHQDDLDWFIMANRPFWAVMAAPIGDHVDYVFRILLMIEWHRFHWYFPGFYTVSVLIHACVIWLTYKLAKLTSGRGDLSAFAAILFTINTNWSETVLWISGQTISITAVFVLLSMIAVWKRRGQLASLLLASWTSALALGLPVAAFLVYGFKRRMKITRVGYSVIATLILVGIIYYFKSTDGTRIEVSPIWALHVAMVSVLAVVNSVIGRLIIPFDRFEIIRISLVVPLLLFAVYTWRGKLREIWRDSWSRFIILQIGIYYLIVALGRAQYGVGIMRADRYAYLGMALLLLLFVRVLRHWKMGKWVWVVPILVLLQLGGLYIKARAYVIRPQQLKTLVKEIKNTAPSQIDPEAYLPHFVLNDERLRYSDLLNLLNY